MRTKIIPENVALQDASLVLQCCLLFEFLSFGTVVSRTGSANTMSGSELLLEEVFDVSTCTGSNDNIADTTWQLD
jgi:hypothetical protein